MARPWLDHARKASSPDYALNCFAKALAEDPTPIVCHGSWPGVITREAAGNGGFGYDPIFFVPSEGKTAAELTREEKSAISHRGRALKLLLEALRNG